MQCIGSVSYFLYSVRLEFKTNVVLQNLGGIALYITATLHVAGDPPGQRGGGLRDALFCELRECALPRPIYLFCISALGLPDCDRTGALHLFLCFVFAH